MGKEADARKERGEYTVEVTACVPFCKLSGILYWRSLVRSLDVLSNVE